ncbi:MAG TPA: GIY-YIG nuclease family protein [Candidatus Absconditabacterales bacterium]|nr:GIY-YIG nuclease family protein [Candidatus Absconditabacterales bacterium]HMT27218.1 GIY-YIG nuclease family protein [Candidatus Absconditabacterales bacterium]
MSSPSSLSLYSGSMNGFVYVLECFNGRWYVGSTNNLERRFEEHQGGKVSSTKNVRPLVLVGKKEFGTLLEARRYELFLKSKKSKEKVKYFMGI